MTSTNALPLKATSASPQPPQPSIQPPPSILNTLRSIYSRAARAFLHRDISLTYSLIANAFTLLPAPPSPHIQSFSQGGTQGLYADQRRKWDILRITLEATVYNSPPDDSATIPAPLRSNAMLSSSSLITALHTRSLQLFTPDGVGRPESAWLPSQILVTLVLASLKTDCALVGRWMIEEWLARRGSVDLVPTGPVEKDGYEKVLEVYCLNVLPVLEEWDYAVEFLEYEGELAPERKQVSHHVMDVSPLSLCLPYDITPIGISLNVIYGY
ncbi:uncharacterized protein STEHIDRAFT_50066 [Stereum hirsutum FP-91666 SS1]|uniref:uncharacterized protein n=1 Tax=Stereum hirsutum (strain FP-91666) TaxID=721885 RepID=UPI000440FB15|nr:uncharacterized protein STEHIDRAFT_50066 [Stereum hirsutum FP-91666 SS1]EIM91475.1 hypothetical protein STEHIDRAFT_50066 [Stereum hirsutum FP-91666 SS1]